MSGTSAFCLGVVKRLSLDQFPSSTIPSFHSKVALQLSFCKWVNGSGINNQIFLLADHQYNGFDHPKQKAYPSSGTGF
jgi:hypothetical protein